MFFPRARPSKTESSALRLIGSVCMAVAFMLILSCGGDDSGSGSSGPVDPVPSPTPLDLDLKVAPTLTKYCIEEGLISRALMQMNALSFSPPLVINESEVDEVIARFQRALNRVTDELVKAGTWKAQ